MTKYTHTHIKLSLIKKRFRKENQGSIFQIKEHVVQKGLILVLYRKWKLLHVRSSLTCRLKDRRAAALHRQSAVS